MREKKGKDFKEVIRDEKRQGGVREEALKKITSVNASFLYGLCFLVTFASLDALMYWLLTPGVLLWLIILVASAAVGLFFASRLTRLVKKRQWRYAC
jgi:Kef-type K+ transport system membrane component KefB